MEDVRAVASLGVVGKVAERLSRPCVATRKLAKQGSAAADRKGTVHETLTHVSKNHELTDYPEYRRWGLPIRSAPVESTTQPINRPRNGRDQFWREGGANAFQPLHAAPLSPDDR
jgi:hypothetical protein